MNNGRLVKCDIKAYQKKNRPKDYRMVKKVNATNKYEELFFKQNEKIEKLEDKLNLTKRALSKICDLLVDRDPEDNLSSSINILARVVLEDVEDR